MEINFRGDLISLIQGILSDFAKTSTRDNYWRTEDKEKDLL